MSHGLLHFVGRTATITEASPRVHCADSAAAVQSQMAGMTGVVRASADPTTGEVAVTFPPI